MTCLATFKTTSAALMFERTCTASGISAKITPVPRSLSSSCGLACEFPCELRQKVEEISEAKKILVNGFHYLEK